MLRQAALPLHLLLLLQTTRLAAAAAQLPHGQLSQQLNQMLTPLSCR
jgi:hypothetical protein